MNIIGDKVVLRAIEESDNEILKELMNNPELEKMLGGSSFPLSSYSQKKWFENLDNKNLRCIVSEKGKKESCYGTVILSDIDYKNGTAQYHIKLLPDSQGKGIGADSTRTIVRYAFDELRLNCIYSEVLSYNIASQRMFEKSGFYKEGIMRQRIFKKGRYVDVFLYSILKKEQNAI